MVNLGKIAYEGYCSKSGNKSLITGAQLPSWDDLSEDIKAAWFAAADAVAEVLG